MIIWVVSLSIFCLTDLILLTECSKNHPANELTIGIIIRSQSNPHHNALADFKKKYILKQAEKIPNDIKIRVFKTHQDFLNAPGHWTILPLFKKLQSLQEYSWFIFMEENTNIHLDNLIKLLSNYNKSEDVFVGHALVDENPTIIHHFAAVEDSALSYPHFSTGFFLSSTLIDKLKKKCENCAFSIDPMYELAKYIWDTAHIKLMHESQLCLKKAPGCATWTEEPSNCGQSVKSDKLFVAVKTCEKFHLDRVHVVKNTWAPDVQNINFFSDAKNETIPTIKLPVQNVQSGHCEKTLAIMKYYVHNNIRADWLIIADDDTLLSFPRLRKLLSCYIPEQFVAIGERYGYSVIDESGYDYLTGGSGMVFSMPTVKLLVRSCFCPSINSPDDMILGLCLKNLNIPITHSPLFHQGRPSDYSMNFLKSVKHISFHKHWLVDPYDVYKTWLKEASHFEHSEL
ncbi:beta-1,3-glucosyltransferase [Parasteatoda tepidariorum]|uniref:beta-1,3-glucosyltransferase n=1 Tax=Parasteatoda tepidariorum TaxID=114398 RepID=UPI00077FA36C|nr:beta-1,3-glucosyltransferase [Parasteatoda tepidariorum]